MQIPVLCNLVTKALRQYQYNLRFFGNNVKYTLLYLINLYNFYMSIKNEQVGNSLTLPLNYYRTIHAVQIILGYRNYYFGTLHSHIN